MKHKYRMPYIEQHQRTECGLCCVAMISSYYYHELSMNELHEIYEAGRDGTSFFQLTKLLNNIGFETKAFRFPKERKILGLITTPAIALWEGQHFVVIDKVKKGRIYIVDPGMGKLVYSEDDFLQHFSQYVVSIISADNVERKKNRESYSQIYKIIFSGWKSFVPLLILSLLNYAVSFMIPLFIGQIMNNVTFGKDIKKSILFPMLGVISIVYFFVLLFQKIVSVNLTASIDGRLKKNIMDKIFHMPYRFFANRSKGDLLYSISGLIRIRDLFVNQFLIGLLDIGLMVCIFCYLAWLNPNILFSCVFFVIVNISILICTHGEIDQKNKLSVRSQNEVQNKETEIVYSIMGIKMEGFEDDIHKQWDKEYKKYVYRYVDGQIYSGIILTISQILTFLAPFFVVFIAINEFSSSERIVGTVFSVYTLVALLFTKTQNVFNVILGFINSKTFISRANEIIEAEEEMSDGEVCNIKGEVKLRNVGFSYTRDSRMILQDINVDIHPGEKIAIVGTSGAGKSTLAYLLTGLYEATQGTILYDGIDEKHMEKKSLRRQIGIVPQNMTLFNKTIYDNIVGDNTAVKEKDVIEACKIANIHEEILNMPMGYNTIISEMGMNLSGGQRQRLILARAIVKNPRIILLDEATSYLDNINERQIMERLKRRKVTTIVIAHRLSTIIDADKILVMNQGRIVEEGTHENLLELKDGLYRKMYKMEDKMVCNY